MLFEEANPETEVEKFIKNVGPSPAMKNIFSFEMEAKNKPYRSVATGNMPLICPEKGRKIVPAFKRTLKPSVQGALGRQRNLFTCLEKDEGDETDEKDEKEKTMIRSRRRKRRSRTR